MVHVDAMCSLHCVHTGAYELPKVAKERVTCVPSKYKSTCRTGLGYTCTCMDYGISSFQVCCMNLVFDATRTCPEVARSFGGSHMLLVHINAHYTALVLGRYWSYAITLTCTCIITERSQFQHTHTPLYNSRITF